MRRHRIDREGAIAAATPASPPVQPNLSQALHLINGSTTWGKIERGDVLGQLMTLCADCEMPQDRF